MSLWNCSAKNDKSVNIYSSSCPLDHKGNIWQEFYFCIMKVNGDHGPVKIIKQVCMMCITFSEAVMYNEVEICMLQFLTSNLEF